MTLDFASAAEVGTRHDLKSIGPYHLVKKLGEGGMGQVWLAEQTAPLRRQVALKLIRVGMYDDSVLQRFYSERESLAIMEHPSIAKVFDAGATPDGQPYFVMEYVPGVPITDYCDRKRLKIRERLELFIQVCQGVQHAHQKAIMHRDLKPANILVVEVDGKPVPRIIDFGLAKAATPQIDRQTVFTQVGGWMGTPGFMSPEQVDPSVVDVDTRTDVYSLGAVLYLLLTGFLPFETKDWGKQRFDEFLRCLREEDPPYPSTKIGTQKKSSKATADVRGTEPEQLIGLLHGDLDWITMKALEKDRTRRYGTSSELAADITHYLNHEPIVARAAGAGYRLQKYVRRHRMGVAVAAGLVLLLAGFAVMQAVQLRRITRERDRANRITDFMTNMFKVSDPGEARGNSITAREILDKAFKDVDTGLAQDPEVQAQMMYVMGSVYDNLGLYSRAQPLLEQAISIQRKSLGSQHPETLKSSNVLAQILLHEGKTSEAEELAHRTFDSTRRVLGSKHPDTLRSMGTFASTLEEKGQYTESEKLDREILETAESVLGQDHVDTVKYRSNLAIVMNDLARYAEAETLERQNLEIDQRTLGPDHPITLNAMNGVAVTLADAGRLPEAEKIAREMLNIQRRILGPEHLDTLRSTSNLANYISDQGRYAEAEKLQRETLEIERRVLSPDHPETVRTMDNLANSLSELRRYTEAETLEREALDRRRHLYGTNHPFTANAAYNLACIFALQGRRDEALSFLRESVNYGLPVKAGLGIETDSDLKSLHGDPRFNALVARAKQGAVEAQKRQ